MSNMYGNKQRAFQDAFQTRKMADRLEEIIVQTEIGEVEQAFIESQPMFFLSTIDHEGQPTVSYKGGAPGFVKVVDDTTIAFPSYDGNGMFYSMGNIQETRRVGLLFIDFETPHRIRFHGEASVSKDDPLMSEYAEAELIARVSLSKMWVNCPRYVHRYELKELSNYVPGQEKKTPLAGWKRIDLVQDVLPPKDEGRPEKEGGVITIEEWMGNVQKGEG
ncbi:MAG: pyridoxamine 5'-phosphate oxidase family protein [Candidatus Thiodiazotropha sp.]|nr:pyridoxamine 5'-phosphate oxidase family protein [Candidatus Thiodiazotropha sp.]MCM8884891.1 pyridoxamine 5'-phosphate oxidase family protein [Candidatus Thiodiazotropha sp.]MCM8921056.1 pyridoxamine 5'-phosphate oxidase family protein [Candidatus Thiodiazotropha sp.]